jgi:hypothetical protein
MILGGLPRLSGKATSRGFSRGHDACSIPGWSRFITSYHSQELIKLMLRLTSDGMANRNAAFIHKDGDKGLPIPVYSSVTPQSPVGFLLHVMLVCGKFETELDFRTAPSMHESRLIAANLIGDRMDTESLRAYSRQLILLD